MKKICYLIFLGLLLVNCSKPKEVDLILGDPDERIADTLALIKKTLVEAPNGWKAAIETDLSGGYGFYMKFGANDRVKMIADLNEKTATEVKESTYRVRQIMATTLSFDTYNYISMLQDPTPDVYNGEAGKGLGSDVEFDYIKMRGDTLYFEGRKFKKTLYLIRASAIEEKSYLAKELPASINAVNSYFETDINSANIGGVKVEITIDALNKLLSIAGISNGLLQSKDIPFGYIIGKNVYLIGDTHFNGVKFSSLLFDNNRYEMIDSEGKKYAISKSTDDIVPPKYKFGPIIKRLTQPGPFSYKDRLPLKTWSTSYIEDWRKYVSLAINSRFGLTIGDVNFDIDYINSVIKVTGSIYQGTREFIFTYEMPYILDMETGYVKFMDIKETNGNGGIVVAYLNESIFKNMKGHNFQMSYIKDDYFGQGIKFTRVDDPNYYFSWIR